MALLDKYRDFVTPMLLGAFSSMLSMIPHLPQVECFHVLRHFRSCTCRLCQMDHPLLI